MGLAVAVAAQDPAVLVAVLRPVLVETVAPMAAVPVVVLKSLERQVALEQLVLD